MTLKTRAAFIILVCLVCAADAGAAEMPLDVLNFNSRKATRLVMFPTRLVPEALMKAEVWCGRSIGAEAHRTWVNFGSIPAGNERSSNSPPV